MQATEGANTHPEPPRVTAKEHYEHSYWNAWTQLGKMSKVCFFDINPIW
jgi:hypothetical protein